MDAKEDFLYTLGLLVQVLLVLNYAWRQPVPDPGKELLLWLPLEEGEDGGQVFVDLRRHRHSKLVRQSVHEFAQAIDVLAVFIL